MINNNEYKLGTIIAFKKSHPSGTTEWVVIRLGADIKVQSTIEESLFIMMPRSKFNRKVKKIIKY